MPISLDRTGTVAENNSAATVLSVPYPTGSVAGKLLVLKVGVASATVADLPAGWIAGGVSSASGGNAPSERIMVRPLTGTLSGSLAVTTASATSRGFMELWSGVDLDNPIVDGSFTASATATTTYVLPAVDCPVPGCALTAMAVANRPGGTWSPPAGWTENAETTGANPSTGSAWIVLSSAGSSGTVSMVGSTNVRGCAGMIALRPAGSGAVDFSGWGIPL